LYRVGLACLRHDRKNVSRPQQRRDRHRDRGARDVIKRREVSLADLLAPRRVVELDLLDVEWIVEVCGRRLVEREVSVLTDAETAHVERMLS